MTFSLSSQSLLTASEKSNSELQIWGGYPLQGEVQISGAKNSALVVMAGALTGTTFLADLPDSLGRFFNNFKQALVSIGLILAAFITLRVVLAVIDALNDISLLESTLKLIGVGYSFWSVNRYLL